MIPPIVKSPSHTLRRLCFILAIASTFLCSSAIAQTDDLAEATNLLRQKQHDRALEKINQFLTAKPRDAQGRFLRGLILADQNKTAEAIDVFTALTRDYPELPEPYNNLAVLYATQGQYEKARQALEQSIRTHPSYATAYENLGDVYAKLASQAYDKALQLDSSNSAAKSKLSMVRDLIGGSRSPAAPAATAAATRPTTVAAVPAPTPAPAPAPATVPAAKAAAPAAVPAAEPTSAGGGKTGNDEILKTVRAWAAAWSDKDVKSYLAFYAKDFETPNREARAEWEKGRRVRIQAPKSIEVRIETPRVSVSGDTATVNFRQLYRSDQRTVNSVKTLVLARSGGQWLIKQERTGNN